MELELSPSQKYARKQCRKTNNNIFINGSAGTGKSKVLAVIVKYLNCRVVAPTGVSAINANGVTLQSFFSIKEPYSFEDHKYKKLKINFDTLIIDEISMVTIDCFKIIDKVLRTATGTDKPMGGLRIIVLGDFKQLPPTNAKGTLSPVCNSDLWKQLNFVECILHKNYRNVSKVQLQLLEQMRNGNETPEVIQYLQERNISVDEAMTNKYSDYVHLFWSNNLMDNYNEKRLSQLKDSQVYSMTFTIDNIEDQYYFKIGARVMCNRNMYSLNVMNGQCGYITDIDIVQSIITVKMDDGRSIDFDRFIDIKTDDNGITTKYNYIPLQLAWGITISKSQGMSLDKTVVYFRDNMFYGQAYVGVSRVRNMDNMKVVNYAPGKNIFQAVETKNVF